VRTLAAVLVLALTAWVALVAQPTRTTLDIYLIDVEGGNATLFVAPSGESLLMDAGNGGQTAARDASRILAAAADAGITTIDHLVITHYHGDHYGGVPELASRIPIRHFIDHGPNVQPSAAVDTFMQKTYPELYGKARRTIAKPGDRVEVRGLDIRVMASAGAVLTTPLAGAGQPNPHCAGVAPQAPDTGENAQSVGLHFTFGHFRALHLGDLTWNVENALMCPNNPIGTVDLWFVTHHGQPISNSPAFVHAIRPRVALMNNGTRKGGQPDAMRVIFTAPGLEDLWQVHASQLSGQEFTVPGTFIANTVDDQPAAMPVAPFVATPGTPAGPPPAHHGPAYWIKVSAREDGSFTVTNARNGFSKTYGEK
jgi:beta-lactamase superfamily II metal-dependent hydrolase